MQQMNLGLTFVLLWYCSTFVNNIELKLLKNTRSNMCCLITWKYVSFTSGNLFSKNNRSWEFIFEEKYLFETSENRNPSEITNYVVHYSHRYKHDISKHFIQFVSFCFDITSVSISGNYIPRLHSVITIPATTPTITSPSWLLVY